MNEQERRFFKALYEERKKIADVSEPPAFRNLFRKTFDQYSDQAHFIYELLQNADDALATKVKFRLEKERLIFIHNGKRHFSVSDPANEEIDSKNKTLGDINSIASFGNSSKKGNSIGKFGIGFKSVLLYTSTPHIYDPVFKFKIERMMIPVLLENDFPGRNPEETIFVFPFDNSTQKEQEDEELTYKSRTPEESYREISEKLENLTYPVLFLKNLLEIEFEKEGITGLYKKEITWSKKYDATKAEHIILTHRNGNDLTEDRLWIFSRQDESERKYSVGYFTDDHGKLRSVKMPAFCFFLTKEETNLHFIIDAPFLLTDNREGIKFPEEHNKKKINDLAELSADSLVYLKNIGIEKSIRLLDDNILDIIPINERQYPYNSYSGNDLFKPFYKIIRNKFRTAEIIPTLNGYTTSANAYWSSVKSIRELFTTKQLSDLVNNDKFQWAFVLTSHYYSPRNEYIRGIVHGELNGRDIFNKITAEFIERQSISWLHRLYQWIEESNIQISSILQKKIFLDQNKKAVAAFDQNNHNILFFQGKDMEGYTFVNTELLENERTRSFLTRIGIKEPSKEDYINCKILPLYDSDEEFDTDQHFSFFFNYYLECPADKLDPFIRLIDQTPFLVFYYQGKEDQKAHAIASSMYYPSDDLKTYFEPREDIRFIDIDRYRELVGQESEKNLLAFLEKLGVKRDISISQQETNWRLGLPRYPYYTQRSYNKYTEPFIEGFDEILNYIVDNEDQEKSSFLWRFLIGIFEKYCRGKDIGSLLSGTYKYFHYNDQSEKYNTSLIAESLRTKRWLINTNGDFVSSNEISKKTFPNFYNTSSVYGKLLFDFLGIRGKEEVVISDKERNYDILTKKLKEFGIDIETEEGQAFLLKLMETNQKKSNEKHAPTHSLNRSSASYSSPIDDEDLFVEDTEESVSTSPSERNVIDTQTKKTAIDIAKRSCHITEETSLSENDENLVDDDEYLPRTADFSKRVERVKNRNALAIREINNLETLQNRAINADRYSYEWFTTLLEMESFNSGDEKSKNQEISISFAKVEREPNTTRTLVLRHPNRYIPHFIEDLSDIPLVLHFNDNTKTVPIEVTNIQSYTLRVKIKSEDDIEGIDLSTVTSATIDTKNPIFLLKELSERFKELNFSPDYNLQKNLCENIEFVFGPPGTGKTTHLVRNVILPMMKEETECKVLVLTPTNKSADLLVQRIMQVSDQDNSYKDWLVRFGSTGEEEIEQSGVYRDKTFDIRALKKSVTVTTIARFPYDFFMPPGERIYLNEVNWDYIIIDEASMIPLANIVYPLYKKTPKKFIIAGDPFQIEPITSVDLWKDENIYTMVNLNSFENPKTIPHSYKVELLTTQYRSVPDIGNLFSRFSYGGVLKHARSTDSQRRLNIGDNRTLNTLNIIKFPVSKYESIYRCKRLKNSSSYQVYSALFTYEYVSYLSRIIAENNPGILCKIGIIAPYRAQADMIDKLLSAEKFPQEIDLQVGTIHGFQGDECDIIFSVFNTPPTISSSKEMFLNKMNIINVSISRARDYLFIVMPDDTTENIQNLHLVKKIEEMIKKTDVWKETLSPDLENLMFGDSNYLEKNVFSTSHQSVNVYGLPEKIYEVRTEDSAVDIQIHKERKESY